MDTDPPLTTEPASIADEIKEAMACMVEVAIYAPGLLSARFCEVCGLCAKEEQTKELLGILLCNILDTRSMLIIICRIFITRDLVHESSREICFVFSSKLRL